jgi:UDP-N-acetylglucosamine--N-acetylmuramyl-(pentapeptide) pyrophosphoryl-undecaprenol N-acetylglucosamine transferase
MRILVAGGGTGGHLYPGLAIARAIRRLAPEIELFFIGARRGIEKDVLPTAGFPHRLLDLHPLYRTRPWKNALTLVGAVRGWREITQLARGARPAVVVGTGGYAAVVTCAWAAAHRIPVVLQEQNSFAGVAARFIARFATEIYLGIGEAAASLRPRESAWVHETGNPIEPPPSPRPSRATARAQWQFPDSSLVLFVTGGSQGARAVNESVAQWIPGGLPDRLHVIWQTGKGTYEQFAHLASDRVRVKPYLSPMSDAYAVADLALSRSGASTLAELCAWGIPSLLVPLPTAAADHQTANARALANAGASVVIPQRELSAERIDREVRALLGDRERLDAMTRAAAARGRPSAADDIARRIIDLARRRSRA